MTGIEEELTYFGLDSITGKLTLQKPLDFEERKLFTLFISAFNVDENGLMVPNTENEAKKFEVDVLDVNDVLPAFTKSEYWIQIRDSSPIGMQILTLSATDLDGPEEFFYSILHGNDDELYQINPSTGVLEITKSLKDADNATLNVSVTNNGGSHEDTCLVHLAITKDAASIFTQAQYSVSIQEGVQPQFLVNLNISITDPAIEISFENPTHNDLFEINQETGDVSTKVQLNYEDSPEYNLVIKATDGQFISTVIVTVSVINIDDEGPTITSELTGTFSVQENAPMGTIVGYIEANDPDSPNLIFTISTTPPPLAARRKRAATALPFEMLSSNGTGFLVVTSTLDASTQSVYQIYITVADSAGNLFPEPLHRSIVIQDINDNAPQFNQTEYRFSVSEDTAIGTTIGQLFASDIDINATLTYNAPGDQQKFRVNNQSEIVVQSELDFETRRTVRFVVLVSDGTLIGITNVIVDILPVFEHKPIFEGPFVYDFKENTPVGKIFQVEARSADQCLDPCTMTFEITNETVLTRDGTTVNVTDFLQIEASDGTVSLLRSLDSVYSEIQVVVKASWGLTWNSTTITIYIQDINNNPPEFIGEPYSAIIAEDSALGTTVISVSTKDGDFGDNAEAEYRLIQNNLSELDYQIRVPFYIHPTSGLITKSSPHLMDFEQVQNYTLVVEARDKGRPSLASYALVDVQIIDVNDNRPVISPTFYQVVVHEDAPIGHQVVQIQAEDKDSGILGDLVYSLTTEDSRFTISSTTGMITVNASLASDVEQIITLSVSVSDKGGLSSLTEAMVNITILQTVRSAPRFSQSVYTFDYAEGTNLFLIQFIWPALEVTDSDSDRITLKVISDYGDLFGIDQTTRKITLNQILDFETQRHYSFMVEASDDSTPPYTDACQVIVNVLDRVDEIPVFTTPTNFVVNISETTPVGHTIAFLHVDDQDTASQLDGGMQFQLLGDTDPYELKVNKLNAYILLKTPLHCAQQQMVLQVEARDAQNFKTNPNTFITVNVMDSNDNCPMFIAPLYKATLTEDSLYPNLFPVKANDLDCDQNKKTIEYSLAHPSEHVELHPTTGMLSIVTPFDYENTTRVEFTAIATDINKQSCQGFTKIVFDILNINDHDPVFVSTNRFSFFEDTPVGTQVFKVEVEDKDAGQNSMQFSIRPNSVYWDHFQITSDGSIFLMKQLDYENLMAGSKYNISIQVIDTDLSPMKVVFQTIEFSILDVNDHKPVFTSEDHLFEINEEFSENVFIGCVKAIDADGTSPNNNISYSIFDTVFSDSFTIDSNGCIHTTNLTIDVDNLLHKSQRFIKLPLYVTAQDHGIPLLESSTTLTIDVLNINDNAPVFHQPKVNISILEILPIGSEITKLQASDVDMNDLTYHLLNITDDASSENTFSIDSRSGIIALERELDFNHQHNYTLFVNVTDGKYHSQCRIFITIINVDNHQPKFHIANYEITISEQTPVGPSVLLTVTASDLDGGKIEYSLEDSDFFDINPNTGDITLKQSLDYETQKLHVLKAIAINKVGDNQFTGTANVFVNIVDANDHRPVFNETEKSVYLKENLPIGSFVESVSATDADSGFNSKIKYEILEALTVLRDNIIASFPSSPFTIDEQSGNIYLQAPLDAEIVIRYVLTISAKDQGDPVLISTNNAIITVHLNDTNDHCPVFQQPSYQTTINETFAPGKSILKVSAEDSDISSTIYYYIFGTPYFITDQFGEISLNKTLPDYKDYPRHDFYVEASDQSARPCRSRVPIRIDILNVNTHQPTIKTTTTTYRVPENTAVLERIFEFQAEDLDGDTLVYSLESVDENPVPFDVIHTKGTVFLTEALDYEKQNRYVFRINVKDGLFTTSKEFTVLVINVNDNEPTFNRVNYIFSVVEESPAGTNVGCVQGTDVEDQSNLRYDLTYIRGSSSAEVFSINQTTGCIQTTSSLDMEQYHTHWLRANVYDTGVPALTDVATVEIQVTDINDNPPNVVWLPTNLYLSEDTHVPTTLFPIQVTDKDSGDNARVLVQWKAGSSTSSFYLDSSSPISNGRFDGQFMLVKKLNYEEASTHVVDFVFFDMGFPQNSVSRNVTIHVLNTNDNRPRFEKPFYNITLPEDYPLHEVFLNVSAADDDMDSKLRYEIQDTTQNTFTINPITGELSLNQTLDFELQKTHTISVTVTDQEHLSRIANTIVQITVSNVNDNSPRFTHDQQNITVNILPDEPVGSLLLTLTATDVDSVTNEELTFRVAPIPTQPPEVFAAPSLIPGLPFTLDSKTGEIRLSRHLTDHDPVVFYFTVQVFDEDQKSDLMVIIIKQVLGNTLPKFDADTYVFTIAENTISGDLQIAVTANDLDSGNSGKLTYQIITIEKNLPFGIENKTGELIQKESLNFEQQKSYTFVVQAIDHGYPQRSTSALVKINVLDQNEVPIFTKTQYETRISETTLPGQPIVLLSTLDIDSGIDGQLDMEISGKSSDFFRVESNTGAILLNKTLNFNIKSRYELTVSLRDKGTPSLASPEKANVTILVTKDMNNGPTFNDTRYIFYVQENQKGVFGKVFVNHDQSSTLVLEIPSQADKSMFSLTNDGTLSIVGNLDREVSPVHHFLIEVYETTAQSVVNRAVVTVHVNDVNDNLPKASIKEIDESIPESTLAGSIISVFQVTDADTSKNQLFVSWLSPKQDHFALLQNGSTVMLVLSKELDYETSKRHQFIISISDDIEDDNEDIIPVSIQVTDVNEFAPVFDQSSYTVSIFQNSTIGQQLLTINATDADASEQNSRITYNILPQFSDRIRLNETTGVVTQIGSFENTEQTVFHFTIIAKDSGTPSIRSETTLTIIVIQQNLNAPTFTKTFYNKDILENSMIGLTVLKFEASDKDKVGKPLIFAISSGDPDSHFRISPDGSLLINKNIDREQIQDFNLDITLRDSGAPVLYSPQNAIVRIKILDQNDNKPVFNTTNTVSILETQPIDQSFVMLSATDEDSGLFGQIEYYFQEANLLEEFNLNENTGQISARKLLKPGVVNLYVGARDGGGNTAQHTIKLTIGDVNSPPVFSPSENTISVSESIEVGATVITLEANDVDQDDELEYSFAPEMQTFDSFEIVGDKVVIAQTLDYETKNSYLVGIVAKDKARSSSNIFRLTINVVDKFFKPAFNQSLYETRMSESSEVNTEVLQMKVTSESTVSFTIISQQPNAQSFEISPTGLITLKKPLDYENNEKHRLVIRASVSIDTYSDAVVIVNVINENEHRPQFNQDSYQFSIRSPTFNNTVVGTIIASDADKGSFGEIIYQITSEDDTLPFVLDQNHIITTSDLLFAQKSRYTLEVKATDGGDLSSNNVEVIINVVDNTDRIPYFQPTIIEQNIAEDTSSGTSLLQLTANDPDTGIYGQLTFSINPSDDASIFSLDEMSGDLSLKADQKLDFAIKQKYVLIVRVTDGVGLTSLGTVILNVVDKNNHAPIFQQLQYKAFIADTAPVGLSITKVHATDKDVVTGHLIFYWIISGNGGQYFDIHGQNGEVKLKKIIEPDMEQKLFTLEIEAFNRLADNTEIVSVNKTKVIIEILSQTSLYIPTFQQTEYNKTIQEPGELDQIQLRVSATISDDRIAETIRYNIQDSKYNDVFRIDPLSGDITLRKSLDREQNDLYVFTVIAFTTFHGEQDKATVLIKVSDANDHFPIPINREYERTIDIEENLPVGSSVLTISTSDEDLGENQEVQFTIKSGNTGNMFEISNNDGILRVKLPLDFESEPKRYVLKVSISDSGNPPRTNPQDMTVTINILNSNDNRPRFDQQQYQTNINETIDENQLILTVNARDADSDKLEYALQGTESEKFRIDSESGQLFTNSSDFNANMQNKFCFLVKVTDGKFSAYSNIIINVLDINNNDPVIINQDRIINIPENLNPGTILKVIEVEDEDQKNSGQLSITIISGNQNLFSISNKNLLILSGDLDFESESQYSITLQATDSGSPPKKSQPVTFQIIVENVNDNTPSISINPEVDLQEGNYNSKEVLTFRITDADGSLNPLSVNLLGEESLFTIQKVSESDYNLLVTGNIDFETKREYALTLIVSDGKFTNVSTINVNILDVNEQPVVPVTSYKVNMSEAAPTNTIVAQIQASDADTGINGKLIYILVTDTNQFTINTETGLIRLVSPLDYETQQQYLLRVSVSDHELQALSNVLVLVNVLPINEHSPTIYTSSKIVTVLENNPLEYKIFANDSDSHLNYLCCRFSIKYQSTPGLFELVEEPGNPELVTLRNTRVLDYEEEQIHIVTVEARDGESPSRVAVTGVQIIIEDQNDHSPIFGQIPQTLRIPETYPIDSIVAFIPVTDLDSGVNAEIGLSFESGNTNGDFELTLNHALVVKNALNVQRTSSYNLVIVAKDQGTPSRDNKTSIKVEIIKENIHPPAFAVTLVRRSIDEGVYDDREIYRAVATDQDGDSLQYTLLGQMPGINITADGAVEISGSFLVKEKQDYSVVIQASDGRSSATMVLQLEILDINEAPEFSEEEITIEIPEQTPVNSLLNVLKATDNDLADNANLSYEVISGNGNNIIRINDDGAVILATQLDYESKNSYRFVIQVKDGGSPSLTANIDFNLNIRNSNEHVPVFDVKQYNFTKPENTVFVETFTARDVDSNTNIVYSLETLSNFRGMFKINFNTGEVVNEAILDYEKYEEIIFNVIATDGKYEAFTQVVIKLTNTNDNKPAFIKTSYNIPVSETTSIDQLLVTLETLDPDEDQVSLSFDSGNNDETFRIQDHGIYLNKKLDFKVQSIYQLSVNASDGLFTADQKAEIVIRVLNENNLPPVFGQSSVEISVNEYVDDVDIYTALATDGDSLEPLSYSLRGGLGYFQIDRNNGTVRIIRPLDHKIISQIAVNIIASDGYLQSVMTLVIDVEDVNEKPAFRQTEYEISLSDATSVGTFLVHLQASDPDSTSNSRLTYQLISDNSKGAFELETSTGNLKLAKKLDHHRNSSFVLQARVSDQGQPALSSDNLATINIQVFLDEIIVPYFRKSIYNERTVENEDFRFFSDVIIPNPHQKVEYSLTEEPTDGQKYLQINKDNGEVTNFVKLDYEKVKIIFATIYVADQKTPDVKGQASLFVNIEDKNEFAPEIRDESVEIEIPENAISGTVLFNFEGYATDNDTSNQGISFRILNRDEFFIIENGTNLILNKTLDYETSTAHSISVQAIDSGIPALRSTNTINVNIKVLNVNEFSPEFPDNLREININENLNIAETFKATDEDRDEVITYSIDETSQYTFEINQDTGVLRNTTRMDYEQVPQYTITIFATDSGLRSNHTILLINLQDMNDNTPTFDPQTYSIKILETTPVNLTLLTVSASDSDSVSEGNIEYYLTKDSDKFRINHQTGDLSLIQPIDFETHDNEYILQVIAKDEGTSHTSEAVNITVQIIDQNDNAPDFGSSGEKITFTETKEINQFVFKVTASDDDLNDQITFSIIGDSPYFNINSTTGVITNIKPIDYEKPYEKSFHLFIKASDSAGTSSTIRIEIITLDQNDNPPSFNQTTYTVQLPMSSNFVVKILASDPDNGANGQLVFEINPPIPGFTIDSTGLVTVDNISALQDIEQIDLKIRVRDSGSPPFYAKQNAIAYITINGRPEPTVVSPTSSMFNLPENAAVGSNVTQIVARINGGHGKVFYFIKDPIEANFFSIDMETGVIKTTKLFDRKKQNVHKFSVIMENTLERTKMTFFNIIVNIIDINDNRPVFESQSKDIFIEESTGIDRLIAVVRATDKDSGENSRITYTITNAADNDDKFKIDEYGSIRLKNKLKFSEKEFYNLDIIATDNAAENSLSSDILTLRITVKETPKVEQPQALVEIPVNDYFEQQPKEVNIELQPDDPGDEDYGYYSMLPRMSWYQVNYQANTNKNGLRKYLAYSVTLDAQQSQQGGTRKRRALDNQNGTVFDPQSVQFEIGSQSECPDPRNKDVPCNGPVQQGKKFRYELTAGKVGENEVRSNRTVNRENATSTDDTVVTATSITLEPFVDLSSGNIHYMIGLVIMGVLLVICITIISFLVYYNGYWNESYDTLYPPSSASSFTLPMQINDRLIARSRSGSIETTSSQGLQPPFMGPNSKRRKAPDKSRSSSSASNSSRASRTGSGASDGSYYVPRAARYNSPTYDYRESGYFHDVIRAKQVEFEREGIAYDEPDDYNDGHAHTNQGHSPPYKEENVPTKNFTYMDVNDIAFTRKGSPIFFEVDPEVPSNMQKRPVTGPGLESDPAIVDPQKGTPETATLETDLPAY
uniref:Cadherin domain-containing protein n=2 Tax=Clytia hemisphaerica TaxID=252671 RepID=A0A7M5XET6_9CNID